MRLHGGVLLWVLAAIIAGHHTSANTSRTRESYNTRSSGQQLRGQTRRNNIALAAITSNTSRSAALIEGSDETIESYSKNQPGRHVCTQEQAVTEPVRTRESYCRPVYKTYNLPCEHGKMCRRYRVVYETAYRDVLKMRVSHKTSYSCCPGWTQGSKASHGCTKAVCARPCNNGGACLKPEMCGCRPGFVGKYCEQDLDECAAQKHTCDHACVNTHGSYTCRCQEGFNLQPDGRTCRSSLGVATTTSGPPSADREELEDDDERDFSVEYVNLTRRISKLEKLMSKQHHPASEKISSVSLNDVTAKLDTLIESLSGLKTRVDRMERRLDHHQKALSRRNNANNEDSRIQTLGRKLAHLENRLDECSCNSDTENIIEK